MQTHQSSADDDDNDDGEIVPFSMFCTLDTSYSFVCFRTLSLVTSIVTVAIIVIVVVCFSLHFLSLSLFKLIAFSRTPLSIYIQSHPTFTISSKHAIEYISSNISCRRRRQRRRQHRHNLNYVFLSAYERKF